LSTTSTWAVSAHRYYYSTTTRLAHRQPTTIFMVQSDRPHHLLPPRSASDPNHRRSDRDRRERKKSLSRPAPSPIQRSDNNSDDKASLDSQTSNGSSGNVQTADVLRGVTGDRVRHGKCAPEFLEAIAVRGDRRLKILTGTEASSFFLRYLG
jgi:hypothetical protein